MTESREIYKTLDLALRIGEVLLSSGAGAADVHTTMVSVAQACGLRGADVDVTFTALSMSYQTSFDDPALIQVRHVKHRVTDYEDLTLVDGLVHELVRGDLSRDEARSKLARIVSSGHRLPRWAVAVGSGFTGGGVALVLGGDFIVTGIAFLAAVGIDLLQGAMTLRGWPGFYQQVAGGLLATLFAVGTAATKLQVDPSLVVSASIVMLLSGVGFMGAIQDALTGFPLTSGARILEAMLSTTGIIAGVSAGLAIGSSLGVDLGRLDPGASGWSYLPVMVFGAAVAAGAWAFSSYAPPRSLLPIALVAGLGEAISFPIEERGFDRAWAVAVAAIAIGVVSYSVSGRFRVPPLVVVVSAIVPLLPGLAIYRGLSLIAAGDSQGILDITGAIAIAIALASGVILGEYVAQPIKREARRLETRLGGPRLVGSHRPR